MAIMNINNNENKIVLPAIHAIVSCSYYWSIAD